MYLKFALIILMLSISWCLSAEDQRAKLALPFTEEQNKDGYRYIWFTYKVAGVEMPHITTAEIPNSKYFKKVKNPAELTIAWWPDYAVLISEKTKKSFNVLTPEGPISLDVLEQSKGKAAFYEYLPNL